MASSAQETESTTPQSVPHQLFEALQSSSLDALSEAVDALIAHVPPEHFDAHPELKKKILSTPFAAVLQQSLRTGIFDEFTWPDFERAVVEAIRRGGVRGAVRWQHIVHLEGSTDYPIVRYTDTAIVFHGAKELRRYTLPDDYNAVEALFYLAPDPEQPMDGDLWAAYQFYDDKRSYRASQSWLSQPDQRTGKRFMFLTIPHDVPLGGGRVLYGQKAAEIGDFFDEITSRDRLPVVWDGQDYYLFEAKEGAPLQCFSFDPQTLKKGDEAWPEILRGAHTEGYQLASASLRHMPQGADASPLGACDGLVGGWWQVPMAETAEEATEGSPEGIYTRADGLSYRGPMREGEVLLQWPGAEGLTAVAVRQPSDTYRMPDYTLMNAQGQAQLSFGPSSTLPSVGFTALPHYEWLDYQRPHDVGFAALPRVEWLHFLRPRDVRLSEQLRAFSLEDAQAFLAAAAEDYPDFAPGVESAWVQTILPQSTQTPAQDWPQTCAAIEARLGPGDATLIGGIAQATVKLRELQLRLEHLSGVTFGATEEQARPPKKRMRLIAPITDGDLFTGLPLTPWHPGKTRILYQNVPQIVQHLAGKLEAKDLRLTSRDNCWITIAPDLLLTFAFFMLRPAIPRSARQHWRDFLEHFLQQGSDLFGARLHLFNLSTPPEAGFFKGRVSWHTAELRQTSDGRPAYLFIYRASLGLDPGEPISFYYATFGEEPPELPPHTTHVSPPQVIDIPDDRARLEEILRLYDAQGPVDYALMSPEQAKTLTEGTALSAQALQWLWAGLPGFKAERQDLLGKEGRAKLGLKAKPIFEAKELFEQRSVAENCAFFAQLVRTARPADLWSEAGFKAIRTVLFEHWPAPVNAVSPKQKKAYADLAKLCDENLKLYTDARALIEALWTFDKTFFGKEKLIYTGKGPLAGQEFLYKPFWQDIAMTLRLLSNTLPIGHPILNHLPALTAWLQSQVPAKTHILLRDRRISDAEEREALLSRVSQGSHKPGIRGGRVHAPGDEDFYVMVQGSELESYISLRAWRSDETRAQYLERYDGPDWSLAYIPLNEGIRFFFGETPLVQAVIQRLQETPVPIGCSEADPRASVPEVVAQIMETYELSEDLAAFYLLTLAHPNPTKKEIYTALGWKAADYQAAGDALVEAQLLVQGKRTGAGRDYFLHGPWNAHVRVEAWKFKFWGELAEERGEWRAARKDLRTIMPWHEIYERVWARIASGNIPKFEEV